MTSNKCGEAKLASKKISFNLGMRKGKILLIGLFLFPLGLIAQIKNLQQSVLWEVKDPATKKVSYLFGTIHLFGASWLDSVTLVKEKFLQSKHVLVEVTESDTVNLDSFKKPYTGPPIVPRKIFTENLFPVVNNYVKSIGWGDIDTLFNGNPQPVLTLLALDWQLIGGYTSRLRLSIPGEDNLDTYFAKQAAAAGKILTGLDDKTEIIVNLGKKQDPKELAKDIEELAVLLQTPQSAVSKKYSDIVDYKNLQHKYFFNRDAPQEDEKGGLDGTNRNKLWMVKLTKALHENKCFVGVGIGHLDFKNGLVNLLRKAGFEVNPVGIKKIKGL